ncbi:MAG: AAA family ATPase [Candidatus Lokiarchaeota archaeon]|nr:AAA family ATPase [Candidatus Lokiarchaeota archaeon]
MHREPLAYRLRPKTIDGFIGQDHIVGEGTLLRQMIESDSLRSVIFYGPAGTGKTTLAEIIANHTNSHFVRLNATAAGIKDVRNAIRQANIEYDLNEKRTTLFIDEVHRFSKNVQDALLPSVEDGTVTIVAGTTENPFFSVIGPLISRSHIFQFESLTEKDLYKVLLGGINHYKQQNRNISIDEDAAKYLAVKSDGDARKILQSLELAVESFGSDHIDINLCKQVVPTKSVFFDKTGSAKYDLASCLQGSIQASDPDAAIYWLARSLESGEDIIYIARRLLVSAAEDVGVGNPIAIPLAHSVLESCKIVGRPECDLHLATLVVFLASSKRNKSAAMAIWEALGDVRNDFSVVIPPAMKDCHYKGAEQLGHGAYHDGSNQDAYVGISKRYFKPENWT